MRLTIACWEAAVQVEGADDAVSAHLAADFGPFLTPPSLPSDDRPAEMVRLRLSAADGGDWSHLLPAGAELILTDPAVPMSQWYAGDREFLLWPGRCAVVRSPERLETDICCRSGVDPYPLVRSEVTQALRRALNRSGRWVVHAGLLWSPESGQALLVPAHKGAGKTSACLLGAAAGMQIVTDEMTVLRPESLTASGLPRRMGLTGDTVARFFPDSDPEQWPLFVSPLDGRQKRLVRPPSLVSGDPPAVTLTGILRPGIWRSGRASIEPVPPAEARLTLYQAAAANAAPPEAIYARAGEWARQLPAWRYLMGQDTAQNRSALAAWLDTLAAA